jgi:hypothetical protein
MWTVTFLDVHSSLRLRHSAPVSLGAFCFLVPKPGFGERELPTRAGAVIAGCSRRQSGSASKLSRSWSDFSGRTNNESVWRSPNCSRRHYCKLLGFQSYLKRKEMNDRRSPIRRMRVMGMGGTKKVVPSASTPAHGLNLGTIGITKTKQHFIVLCSSTKKRSNLIGRQAL